MNLQNNSQEMKTVVETFIIEETSELIHDNEKLDKWNDLVAELGLSGQTKIVQKEKSPIPFMHLKQSLVNVFETLCPVKVGVEEYSITPIPVEILDLIALSKREDYFSNIEIWYDDKNPDPVCIGATGYWGELFWYTDSNNDLKGKEFKTKQDVLDAGGKHPSFYKANSYLLGKWADVKHSFDELKEIAIKRWQISRKTELLTQIKNAQRDLEDLELDAIRKFN